MDAVQVFRYWYVLFYHRYVEIKNTVYILLIAPVLWTLESGVLQYKSLYQVVVLE